MTLPQLTHRNFVQITSCFCFSVGFQLGVEHFNSKISRFWFRCAAISLSRSFGYFLIDLFWPHFGFLTQTNSIVFVLSFLWEVLNYLYYRLVTCPCTPPLPQNLSRSALANDLNWNSAEQKPESPSADAAANREEWWKRRISRKMFGCWLKDYREARVWRVNGDKDRG